MFIPSTIDNSLELIALHIFLHVVFTYDTKLIDEVKYYGIIFKNDCGPVSKIQPLVQPITCYCKQYSIHRLQKYQSHVFYCRFFQFLV